ncbi:tyrosine--tRNA ligase [bacterium]|nr:tyrosine--tRNA ligase [candidate division CSSED10-310 bacterium]
MKQVLQELQERDFVYQISDPALGERLEKESLSVYAGFDPSADSLHLGHLIPVIGLMRLQRAGHRPIAVVGGATGMIGDPSGRDQERQLLDLTTIRANEDAIRTQLSRFLDFDCGKNSALLVNNYDWLGTFGYLDFLRTVGKHFSVNAMIAKDSVKQRLENRDQGISYTEFSYQILQAYDFYHLWKAEGCLLQIGGSDQWGNITAGIDLCRRMGGPQLYGITFPLLMTAGGKKFGKSEGNAVWLDAALTQPYTFYQYFIQTDDRDVMRFLRLFTFISIAELTELAWELESHPEDRLCQRRLAAEVTQLVHGKTGLMAAESATRILFGGEPIEGFNDNVLKTVFSDVPSSDLPRTRLENGYPIVDLLVDADVCKSKGEARRLINSGGAYCNNIRLTSDSMILTLDNLASESILVFRSGKKNYHLVSFV